MNTTDFLKEKTTQHLELMEHALQISKSILNKITSTDNADIDEIAAMIDNRSRLINILFDSQAKIEHAINSLTAEEINDTLVCQLKRWQNNLNNHIVDIDKIDQGILEFLENEKTETSINIGRIFKFKQTFKGYNLNDVRR